MRRNPSKCPRNQYRVARIPASRPDTYCRRIRTLPHIGHKLPYRIDIDEPLEILLVLSTAAGSHSSYKVSKSERGNEHVDVTLIEMPRSAPSSSRRTYPLRMLEVR
jgi:hypothetical protein